MLNKSLIQGSLSMLILRLLDEKDMYGYEMIETLRKRSENVFELKAGSLYPLLHALEANNLVTAYEDDASGKMRKYYHITGEGKRILKEKKDEWNTYAAAVTNVLSCKAMEMCILKNEIASGSEMCKKCRDEKSKHGRKSREGIH